MFSRQERAPRPPIARKLFAAGAAASLAISAAACSSSSSSTGAEKWWVCQKVTDAGVSVAPQLASRANLQGINLASAYSTLQKETGTSSADTSKDQIISVACLNHTFAPNQPQLNQVVDVSNVLPDLRPLCVLLEENNMGAEGLATNAVFAQAFALCVKAPPEPSVG